MTLLVPFDGSELAEAALVRAVEFATVFDQEVLAVSVVPQANREYARERGWVGPEESFDTGSVVASLHRQVTALCPSADFRHEVVGRYAPTGAVAKRLRRTAKDEGAAMVFLGSENAGRIVSGVSSVGASVATETAYDVVIVRHRRPAKVAELKESSPHRRQRSDFYVPE
jgi:nucleotide-binding universal stress UspA family protein